MEGAALHLILPSRATFPAILNTFTKNISGTSELPAKSTVLAQMELEADMRS